MTRLADATLEQLTMAFRTISTVATRSRLEPTTLQLVYAALAELGERRRLDTALVAVVNAAKSVVDGALEVHETSAAFELAMARLELALLELDELRAAVPSPETSGAANQVATP